MPLERNDQVDTADELLSKYASLDLECKKSGSLSDTLGLGDLRVEIIHAPRGEIYRRFRSAPLIYLISLLAVQQIHPGAHTLVKASMCTT
jgi:hypothetical protein